MCPGKCDLPFERDMSTCACECNKICPFLTSFKDLTTCECVCLSSCPAGQTQNPNTCECECQNRTCPAGQTWNPNTCECECSLTSCQSPRQLNKENCTCECNKKCRGYSILIEHTCQCFCPVRCLAPFVLDEKNCDCIIDKKYIKISKRRVKQQQSDKCNGDNCHENHGSKTEECIWPFEMDRSSKCVCKKRTCPDKYTFDMQTCSCNYCPLQCDEPKHLNTNTCSCECPSVCGPGQIQDSSCLCSPRNTSKETSLTCEDAGSDIGLCQKASCGQNSNTQCRLALEKHM